MTRDWESAFSFWARPPSKTEEQRSENAIGAIRNAVNGSSTLKQRKIKVFTQGSYRNRVNVRQDSDVDVGVMLYYDSFLDEYPEGKTRADFGNIDGDYRVYPGFPTLFWGLSGFFVNDLMGKALWSSWKTRSVFQGAVGAFCASTAPSASTGPICMRQDRRVLGLQSTRE